MRLFLLPISTRRTLIYAQRLAVPASEQLTYLEKGTKRAAKLWADWEKKESGWQKKVVDWGNVALKRIPYEEWGLKSIPPLTAARQEQALLVKKAVEVYFPSLLIAEPKVKEVLKVLSTERQALHKSRMIYSFIGMPISAPFALVPVVPNLPFFYLVYRAWSHWRALAGSKHIQFLLANNLIRTNPSQIMNDLYSAENTTIARNSAASNEASDIVDGDDKETMVLLKSNAKMIAKALEVPELEMELDRAIWQVETKLKGEQQLKDEKRDLNTTASNTKSRMDEKEKL